MDKENLQQAGHRRTAVSSWSKEEWNTFATSGGSHLNYSAKTYGMTTEHWSTCTWSAYLVYNLGQIGTRYTVRKETQRPRAPDRCSLSDVLRSFAQKRSVTLTQFLHLRGNFRKPHKSTSKSFCVSLCLYSSFLMSDTLARSTPGWWITGYLSCVRIVAEKRLLRNRSCFSKPCGHF